MNISASFHDWSELPDHLLELVAGKLEFLGDRLCFSAVCKSWNRVQKDNEDKRHPRPMLLVNPDGVGKWKVYDVSDDKILDLELRVPNRRLCGSSKGWLVFVEENYAVTLVNPALRVEGRRERENSSIQLPQLPILPSTTDRFLRRRFDHYVHKAIISADPILNPQDCIIVIIVQPFWVLAFFRLHKDTTWTYVDERVCGRGFYDLIFFEDKVYGVQSDARLLSFEINNLCNSKLQVAARSIQATPHTKKTYLFTIEKELWLVERSITFDREPFIMRTTVNFVVYKMDSGKRRWIKRNNVGGVTLFLGDNSLFTVPASSFPGCLADCIYFTHDYDAIHFEFGPLGPNDFGAYDVKHRCFLPVDTKHISTLVKMSIQPPIWILPTF